MYKQMSLCKFKKPLLEDVTVHMLTFGVRRKEKLALRSNWLTSEQIPQASRERGPLGPCRHGGEDSNSCLCCEIGFRGL